MELSELQQLVITFAGPCSAEHVFATSCPRCKAERQLRELGKSLAASRRAAAEELHGIVVDRAYVDRQIKNAVGVTCKCGAFWTHPNGTSDAEIRSTYESHLKYFARPGTVTL